MTTKILTQSRLKSLLHYNQDTGIFTRNEKPTGCIIKTKYGKQYIRISINYKKHLVHRLAFLYMTGKFPVNQVDHINGNGRDNRWCNLREATASENSKNKRLSKTSKTGYSGITIVNKKYKKYRAQISVNSKQVHVGIFTNLDDAISARKEAEIKYGFHENHGEERAL